MSRVCLLRHAPTEWNRVGRLQGRADLPVSEEARAEVRRWRLPPWTAAARAWTSPLRRAVETARLIGRMDAQPVPALVEMDWGRFEGHTLAELRAADPVGFAALEARGLDLRPPGGESPRMVVARLAAFFRELARLGGDHLLVTHKGVSRAALALATGWDLVGPAPLRLKGPVALLLVLDPDGGVRDPRLWPLLDGNPRRSATPRIGAVP